MIELKVTIENVKKPNDVVNCLNTMIEDMSFIVPIVRVKAATNGNHCGYGFVHIVEQLSSPLDEDSKRIISIIAHDIIVELQKKKNVKQVEVYHSDDELTSYFLYNYQIIGGSENDNYIKINPL